MNNKRRKELTKLIDEMEVIKGKLEDLQSEEQEAYDAMPEGLAESERATTAEAAAEKLQEAYDAMDEACDAATAARDGES
jgi:hypothetical protein